ncbi:hypothetical protein H4R34_005898, partial [Dimargaris verticillata]
MSRDRLNEFRADVQRANGPGYSNPNEMEMGSMKNDSNLAGFYEEVRQVEYHIGSTQQKVDQIDRLNQRTLQAVGEDQTNRCREERD